MLPRKSGALMGLPTRTGRVGGTIDTVVPRDHCAFTRIGAHDDASREIPATGVGWLLSVTGFSGLPLQHGR